MNAIESFDVDGLAVKLYHDEDAQNPREDENDPAVMVCWHRRYTLGDDKKNWAERWEGPADFLAWAKRTRTAFMVLYLYDHSGISMSCSSFVGRAHHADWDSGPVGFIYWDKARAAALGCDKPEWRRARKEKDMRQQVETYNQYLTGDVYGYVVEDADGEHLDSCWGFFGREYAEGEARSAAKSCAKSRADEDAKNARTLAHYAD